MLFHELLAVLAQTAQGQRVTVYLVGGCVRDGLQGRPLVDVDLAVEGNALPYAQAVAIALSGSYVAIGERHAIARVVLPEGDVRQIDFASAPDGIAADLARRDFTIDAMAVALDAFDGVWAKAVVLDPHSGRADLAAGLIRMTSADIFRDDPLRLLRGVRLAAELGFALEEATAAATAEQSSLIVNCAGERVREELLRMLSLRGAVTSVELMDRFGLLGALFPELMVGKGVGQPKEHHWDVFTHQVETIASIEALLDVSSLRSVQGREYLSAATRCAPRNPQLAAYLKESVGGVERITLLKLAALFHDVAKPQTKTVQPDGRIRFFGHSEQGADSVRVVLQRLHFSNREIDAIAAMVEHHLRPGQWSDVEPSPRALYRYFRDVGNVAVDTILLNLADHLAARGPGLIWEHWQQHVSVAERAIAYYFEQQEQAVEPRLITGNDLMEYLALEPGPSVGRLLGEIEEARAVGQVRTKEEALRFAKKLRERETAAPRGK